MVRVQCWCCPNILEIPNGFFIKPGVWGKCSFVTERSKVMLNSVGNRNRPLAKFLQEGLLGRGQRSEDGLFNGPLWKWSCCWGYTHIPRPPQMSLASINCSERDRGGGACSFRHTVEQNVRIRARLGICLKLGHRLSSLPVSTVHSQQRWELQPYSYWNATCFLPWL